MRIYFTKRSFTHAENGQHMVDEGSHRADYLFSSQYFVLHNVFLSRSLSIYWWLSVSREIITLSATARLQKQKRGESVFPLRESERKEMWLGNEN